MKKIYLFGLVGISLVAPLGANDFNGNEIIGRLEKHVIILSSFDATTAVLGGSAFLKDVIAFKHEHVKNCAKRIACTSTLVPLSHTFNSFLKQANCIDEELFLREFTQLLLVVYKNTLDCLARGKVAVYKQRAPSLITIFTLYVRILSLPIGDLLNILDFCHAQFNEIIHEHNSPSYENWWQWLKGNWWVPPVILAALFTSTFMKYAFSYNEEPAFC